MIYFSVKKLVIKEYKERRMETPKRSDYATASYCLEAAYRLLPQVRTDWQDFSKLEIRPGAKFPAMGQEPMELIFLLLRTVGCEIQQNSKAESGWEIRRELP